MLIDRGGGEGKCLTNGGAGPGLIATISGEEAAIIGK